MLRGFLRVLANAVKLPLWPLWLLTRALGSRREKWLQVRLGPRLPEWGRPRNLLHRLMPRVANVLPTSLHALDRTLAQAARDPRVRGVVLELSPLQAGWASCTGLRELLRRTGQGDLEVALFLPHGGGVRELYVAGPASRVFLGPHASVSSLGLAMETRYLKGLLDRVGVELEPIAQGQYKTAAERFARESMSEAQREQLSALLGDLQEEIATSPPTQATGIFHGAEAVQAGVVSDACYEDQLLERLGIGSKSGPRLVAGDSYLASREARFFRPLKPEPYIAVVPCRGAILAGGGARPSRGVDLNGLVAVLRSLRRERLAAAVILDIDSPGGSATASDLIHREVVRLAERKPVVARFGNVAASGGYYIAAGAHAIVAQPTTVTGSIGVIAAKVVAARLQERLGVRSHTLQTGPHADMFSWSRPLTAQERAMIERETEVFYRAFVSVVAEGRKQSSEDVHALAQGRVWSGRAAHAHGLVDRLGGMPVALEEARSRIETRHRGKPLRPRLVKPTPHAIPSPPDLEPAARWLDVATGEPHLGDLLRLVSGGERVLFYAATLPQLQPRV